MTCSDECEPGKEQLLISVTNYESIDKGLTANLLSENDDSLLRGSFTNKYVKPVLGMCVEVNKPYKINGINNDLYKYL